MESRPEPRPSVRAGALMARAFRDVIRPPFSVLIAVSVLIYLVSGSLSSQLDDVSLFMALLLAVLSAYLQIAVTLAAGAGDPARGADPWIRMAFTRRVFWRYFLSGLVSLILVAAGFAVLIVGGLYLGALFALAQPAAVLERAWPPTALQRSVALSRGSRLPVGTVFALLVTVPTVAVQVGFSFRASETLGVAWTLAGALVVLIQMAGVIALTRAYVELGGAPTPLKEEAERAADPS